MKKWIFIGGGIVIVIIIVIFVVGISNIGPLIKTAVNTYGPGITQTAVSLEDVSVSIFSGEAKLKGFYLGNPKGFKSPEAMKVGSILVDVDEKSLMKDPMIIDRIEITRPEITYEKAKGTDNFRAIINNVQKTVGMGESPKEKSKEKGKGKKLLIRDFVVKDGRVTLTTAFLENLGKKSISAQLPDIHLKNIGGEKEGALPAKVSEEILAALYGKITSSAVTDSLNKELKALGTNLEGVTEGAKKQIESVVKGTKEERKKALDKVKGLFGK
jgi:uncharacterized protein involved in outer membrane biogenesis